MKDIRHEPMNVNNIHSDVKVGVQIKMLPVVCLTLLHMPQNVIRTHQLKNNGRMMKMHN